MCLSTTGRAVIVVACAWIERVLIAARRRFCAVCREQWLNGRGELSNFSQNCTHSHATIASIIAHTSPHHTRARLATHQGHKEVGITSPAGLSLYTSVNLASSRSPPRYVAKFGGSGSSAVPRCVVNGEFCGDACGVKLLMNEPTAFIRPFSSSAEASPAEASRAVELSATATSSADAGRTRALPPRLLFAEPDGERRGEEEEVAAAAATAVDELRLRATNALREEEVGAPPPAW